MRKILIADSTAIGPFESDDDAISYAIHVLGVNDFDVRELELPATPENIELINQSAAH